MLLLGTKKKRKMCCCVDVLMRFFLFLSFAIGNARKKGMWMHPPKFRKEISLPPAVCVSV